MLREVRALARLGSFVGVPSYRIDFSMCRC
jgi:hypothetical protein